MDFATDQSGRYLLSFSRLVDAPAFVKAATIDAEALASLARNQFADTVAREFPIDDPGHVYLSYGYMKVAGIQRPDVEQRIKRAAALFNITDELAKIDEALAQTTKSASAASEFAVSIDFTGAPEHMKSAGCSFYPINTPSEITDSARRICEDRSKIPVEVFVEGCQNIVKAARAHALETRQIPSSVWEFGDDCFVDYDHVQFQAEKRAALTGDQLYVEISKSAAEDLDTPVENWVAAWRQADRQNGLEGRPGIKEAHRVFYSGVDKAAFDARLKDWLVLSGAAVPKSAVASIPPSSIAKHFPGSAVAGLTELVKRATVENGITIQTMCKELDPAVQRVLLTLALQQP